MDDHNRFPDSKDSVEGSDRKSAEQFSEITHLLHRRKKTNHTALQANALLKETSNSTDNEATWIFPPRSTG